MRPSANGRSETGSWLPVLAYAAAVVVVSSIPGDDMPSGPWWRADKLIHFGEYLVLGALLARAFVRGPPRLRFWWAVAVAVALASTFAASDEWHQSFVPGRSASPMDAVADVLGACLGAVAAALYYRHRGAVAG